MEKLLLKFIQSYKNNVVRIEILGSDVDYFYVECEIETVDVYSPDLNMITYTNNCKVSVKQFNKFREIEEAVIWD